MGKHQPKIKVGDKFTLKCGTVVEVIEYGSSKYIIVESNDGVTKQCRSDQLHENRLAWGAYKRIKEGRRASPKAGERYESNNHGWFKVLSVDGYSNMTIQFENTGEVKSNVYTQVAFSGKVRDPSIPRHSKLTETYKIGSRWESNNYGWFTILEVFSSVNTTIQWESSGYIQTNVTTGAITSGVLADQSRSNEWDYLKPTQDRHYVYIAKLGGEVIYIGKGIGRRYLHPTSGCSHSKELNRLHFAGEDVTVEIHTDDLSEQEAFQLEKLLIKEFAPRCNQRVYVV